MILVYRQIEYFYPIIIESHSLYEILISCSRIVNLQNMFEDLIKYLRYSFYIIVQQK